MIQIEEWLDNHGGEDYCRYCNYSDECHGMTSDGSGQPCFPPCADCDNIEDILDLEQLEEDIQNGEWDYD